LLAHGRADAVGADEQIGGDAFAIGKMRSDLARVLGEAREPAPAVVVR